MIDQPYQFDFYDGGGLDAPSSASPRRTSEGNLNVSKFGPRLAGAGGFINISQNAKKVVFVGTFTAGGLEIAVENGRLRIVKEGKLKKFVRAVEHRTFSGGYAVKRGQPVLYVTERCVFELTKDGLELIEVAPGIDVEREILAQMEFRPVIRRDPAIMDRRIFAAEPMGLRDDLLRMPLEQRFTYDPQQGPVLRQFRRPRGPQPAGRRADPAHRRRRCWRRWAARSTPSSTTTISRSIPDIVDEYSAMVRDLVDRFYSGATRYTTSGFLRSKLGDAFDRRAVAPHILRKRGGGERASARAGRQGRKLTRAGRLHMEKQATPSAAKDRNLDARADRSAATGIDLCDRGAEAGHGRRAHGYRRAGAAIF